MPKYKVLLDKEKCIGCGTCIALCPDHFVLEDDKAKVIKDEVDSLDCVSEAESSCPVAAISTKEIG
jgi:ferredoxin